MQRQRNDLRPFQEDMVDFIKDRRYAAAWVGMRLGKTIATLTALKELYDEFDMFKTLVVAPLRVSINSWPQDFKDWPHLDGMDYQLIRGTPSERVLQLKSPAPVHIINRELLAWLVTYLGKGKWPYDTLVLDESRSFKNHRKYTKKGAPHLTRFGAAALIRPQLQRVIELTGTPAPRGYDDLWAQTFLLDGGKRLEKNISTFRQKYMHPGRQDNTWVLNDDAPPKIETRVKDLVFTTSWKPKDTELTNPVLFDLPPKVRETYNELEKDCITILASGKVILTPGAGPKRQKLLQICAGAVYTDKKGSYDVLHKERYKALTELRDLIEGPVVLIYNYKFEKDLLLKEYPKAKVLDSKPQTVKDWNAGKIDELIMHPASGGHGLTLYEGGNDIIWMSPTDDLELEVQVNKRLSHPDKKAPVTIHQILASGTQVETGVLSANALKAGNQDHLIQAARDDQKKRKTARVSPRDLGQLLET